MKKETYDVTGMSCAACSSRVEKAVAKQPGAQQVAVNLLKNSMVVEYDESQLSSAQIIAAVEKAGYGASLHAKPGSVPAAKAAETGGASAAQKAYSDMKKRLALSLIFTIPLFYLSMGHMMGWPLPACFLGMENAMTFAFTQFLLLLPIVYINRQYYIVGFKTLWQRSPNMDSLIALGSSAAIVYGIYAIYKIGIGFGQMDMDTVHTYMMELYFESAGTILTLITMGKTMEARAKGKTSDAITKLMDLAPKTATVERDGVESGIPVEETASSARPSTNPAISRCARPKSATIPPFPRSYALWTRPRAPKRPSPSSPIRSAACSSPSSSRSPSSQRQHGC